MRRLDNWIASFLQFTELLPSPEIFRRWAGICAVAGALERKVWIRAFKDEVYPHLYTVLVGPPGVGKTTVSAKVWELWESLSEDGHFVASTSLMKAGLIDDLRDAERRVVRPMEVPAVSTFNSLKICSNELSVLIPGWDNDFMGVLTHIWDAKTYSERRRSSNLNFKIDKPQINLLAATTPSHLNSLLPEGAWDGGFLSRTILIYSGEVILSDIFQETEADQQLWFNLTEDLRHIGGELYGRYDLRKNAAKCIKEWHMEGGPPQPEHPKLTYYCIRRTAQILKLSMIAAASQGDKLEITLDHVQQAFDWLLEAEAFMPDIFKSMNAGGDSRVIEDTWYFIYQIYMKKKEPIAEHRIVHFLQERVPAHNVSRILDVMQRANIIEKQLNGFVPRSRRER